MTFFDPLSDPHVGQAPASDTAGDRTSYLASYLAAQKPTKRQPDIYQAVFNYYLAVLETRLLMVHPSLAPKEASARFASHTTLHTLTLAVAAPRKGNALLLARGVGLNPAAAIKKP